MACRDALWLPYRKDKAQLKEAIEAAGPVKAIFAHADVVRCQTTAAWSLHYSSGNMHSELIVQEHSDCLVDLVSLFS